MAVTQEVLVPSKFLENTQSTQYTAADAIVVITKCTVVNTSANNVVLNLNIVPSGGSASDANILIKNKTIAPNETYRCPEMINKTLKGGYFISGLSSVASALNIAIDGSIIT